MRSPHYLRSSTATAASSGCTPRSTATSTSRAPRPSSLADLLDVLLDKGIVIDAYVRVARLGVDLVTVDARVMIASVDTYLRFAEAVNRLDLQPEGQVTGAPGAMREALEAGPGWW